MSLFYKLHLIFIVFLFARRFDPAAHAGQDRWNRGGIICGTVLLDKYRFAVYARDIVHHLILPIYAGGSTLQDNAFDSQQHAGTLRKTMYGCTPGATR
jgi:hypothetical protein